MFLVHALSIDGKWAPKDGRHVRYSYFGAAVETFVARLEGKRSRIVGERNGEVYREVPPRVIGTATVSHAEHATWRDVLAYAVLWAALFGMVWLTLAQEAAK